MVVIVSLRNGIADFLTGWTAVRMSSNLGLEIHLDDEQAEDRKHHDDTGHCGIVFDEDIREAIIRQRCKCRGHQVHEGCRNQHTRAKVLAGKEQLWWYFHPFYFLRNNGKAGP